MSKTILQHQVTIDALPSKVWKVLTSPHYISQYLFEGSIHCEWTEGGSLTLIPQNTNGTKTIKGSVLEAVPGTILKYSLQDDSLSGFTCTTYELIPSGEGVELKLQCEGCTDSEEEYLMKMHQLQLLLQKIKWLAEFG